MPLESKVYNVCQQTLNQQMMETMTAIVDDDKKVPIQSADKILNGIHQAKNGLKICRLGR